MVHYSASHLDASFAALSDATRRGVIERLAVGEASISVLAERFHMTLTGMRKHVSVLEHAGLVRTEKIGRVRTCRLNGEWLQAEAAWIETQRQLWAMRFEQLDDLVEDLKHKDNVNEPKR